MDSEVITINERGALTLPASVRKDLGITGKQQMIVEMTESGEILLKPAVTLPIELYTEERIAEFARDEAHVAKTLKERGIL